MISRLLFAIFFGAVVGLIAGFLTFWPHLSLFSQNNSTVSIGGPFTLVDMNGEKRTEKNFMGKPMLIFFGFTNCPDICPSGLQTLTIALNNIGKDSQKLSSVFVSIDPERDTPQVLMKYVSSFHPQILALTGSQEQINGIVKAYRVYTKKISDQTDPERYFFDHSSFFYLMDKNGKYIKHYPSTVQVEVLSSELSNYLSPLNVAK